MLIERNYKRGSTTHRTYFFAPEVKVTNSTNHSPPAKIKKVTNVASTSHMHVFKTTNPLLIAIEFDWQPCMNGGRRCIQIDDQSCLKQIIAEHLLSQHTGASSLEQNQ